MPICPASYPNCKPNYDVQASEYPCDLFQYIFATQAWKDTNSDNFCERRLPKVSQKMGNGTTQSVNVDEAFLYTNAALILPTSANVAYPTAGQKVSSCGALISATRSTSFTGGIVWDQTGGCTLSSTIGWPDKPVAWVGDGNVTLQGGTVFGLVFVRDTSDPTTVVGGAATFDTVSSGTIYGAAIVQGSGDLRGSSAIIYNGTVLKNLSNLQATNPASQVPGSWTDRYVY